jgi:hypothetical protein
MPRLMHHFCCFVVNVFVQIAVSLLILLLERLWRLSKVRGWALTRGAEMPALSTVQGNFRMLECLRYLSAPIALRAIPAAFSAVLITAAQGAESPKVSPVSPSGSQTKIGCPGKGPLFLVLGVWITPPDEMRAWKQRGVNTIISVGQGIDVHEHNAKATALGLHQIRAPLDDIQRDLADARVLAFETSDEPSNLVHGSPRLTPEQVGSEQKQWREAMQRSGQCKPVFTNHVGNHIWHANSRIGLDLADYHRQSDWYGADAYQIADGRENLLTQEGFASTFQGHILHQQRLLAPTAPLMSFVQTAAFEPNIPLPTPGELKTQIWSSIVHDASMIGLFPVRLGPVFAWDATPPGLVSVIANEFAELKSIEHLLIDTQAGGSRPGTIYFAAPKGSVPKTGQLPWPFEARVIPYRDQAYTVVVNLANSVASLTIPEWGVGEVRFQPHEVKHGFGRDWINKARTDLGPSDAHGHAPKSAPSVSRSGSR